MDASLFTFAYDVVEEGADAVAANAADRAGVGGVTMAVTYHEGRDVFPHARTLAWIAVVLLTADALVEILRARSARKSEPGAGPVES